MEPQSKYITLERKFKEIIVINRIKKYNIKDEASITNMVKG